MKINFGEIKIGHIARNRINKALDDNWISEGENTREFEKMFSERFGYKHSIAVSSGTSACMCACMCLYDIVDAKQGDEIIVPATTFVATINAVRGAGFTPVFVDIEEDTLNINPELIVDAITDKTVAIMPVHLMGKPCDMDKIMDIANNHNLIVIEDCCEAHGATYKDIIIGNFGIIGCFSFYVAHPIVCGEGGMVVTNDNKVADIIRSVKSHGRPTGSLTFDFQRYGLNFKTNNLCSAIGVESMFNFEQDYKTSKHNLSRLMRLTKDLSSYCYMNFEQDYESLCPHAFFIVIKKPDLFKRDKLIEFLNSEGIDTKTLFGSLPTQHPAFKYLGYNIGDFPIAEYVGSHGFHIGVHQYLSDDDVVYISDVLHKFFKGR